MLVPPAHVTNKNVGLSPKNVGDFLKNVGLFPKNVGVFFENVGDFFCRSERLLFLLADENFSCQTDYNPQNEKLHRRETKRCLPENEAYP